MNSSTLSRYEIEDWCFMDDSISVKNPALKRCAWHTLDTGCIVSIWFNPDCVPPWRDSEAYKTLAKREVGAILNRRHIHKYVDD